MRAPEALREALVHGMALPVQEAAQMTDWVRLFALANGLELRIVELEKRLAEALVSNSTHEASIRKLVKEREQLVKEREQLFR